MSASRCDLCQKPLSMRPEKAGHRREVSPGVWVHASCVELESLLAPWGGSRDVFAASRQRVASDAAGASSGHTTHLDRDAKGVYWVCSCGMRGESVRSMDKAAAQRDAREHKRARFVAQD